MAAYFKNLAYTNLISRYEGMGQDLGTLKYLDTTQRIVSWDPSGASTYVASVNNIVPNGTKALLVNFIGISSATNDAMYLREHDLTVAKLAINIVVVNIYHSTQGIIRINSTMEFDIYASAATIFGVYVDVLGYCL